MNFNELYPKKKEYYYLLMDIKTTAECNVSNCVIDKQKAKLLMRYINKQEKEVKRLNNIINELEKKIILDFTYLSDDLSVSFVFGVRNEANHIYKELQELKGSDKE